MLNVLIDNHLVINIFLFITQYQHFIYIYIYFFDIGVTIASQ